MQRAPKSTLASLLSTIALLGACRDPATIPLVASDAWTQVPDAEDPFADLAEGERVCDAAQGILLESGFLEILTDACPWATVTQPLAADVRPGELLRVVAFHGSLFAAEPGEGLLALWIGDTPIWEEVLPIPSSDRLYNPELPAPARFDAGEPVFWHVHNHGGNDYRLVELSLTTRRRLD